MELGGIASNDVVQKYATKYNSTQQNLTQNNLAQDNLIQDNKDTSQDSQNLQDSQEKSNLQNHQSISNKQNLKNTQESYTTLQSNKKHTKRIHFKHSNPTIPQTKTTQTIVFRFLKIQKKWSNKVEKAEIRKMVKSAMNKVFAGNSGENVGVAKNHLQEKTKKYFLALNNDEK